MARRKNTKRVPKQQKIKLDTVFDCPFCSNERCVKVTMKQTRKQGIVFCRICDNKYTYPINDLTFPTHIYGMFIEDCENANKFFDIYEKFLYNIWGPQVRNFGQTLNKVGISIQGSLATDDRLVPSLRSRSYQGTTPQFGKVDFVAPNSAVIGRVNIGDQSSVWYGSTLRGDLNEINVGKNTVIQDLVTLAPRKQNPTSVGDNVYIGPACVLDSCTVESNAFIGMGATLRAGSKVESYGIVAAGAVVPENTTVPSYQIWAGNPAHYLRDLSNEEKEILDEFHGEMQSLARVHAEESNKTFRQVINDLDQDANEESYDPEDFALQKMKELGFPVEAEDEDFIEQRVFYKDPELPEEQHWKKNYDPYEQDVYNFPDSFKVYGENYGRYEELQKYFEENPNVGVQTVEKTDKVKPTVDAPWTRRY